MWLPIDAAVRGLQVAASEIAENHFIRYSGGASLLTRKKHHAGRDFLIYVGFLINGMFGPENRSAVLYLLSRSGQSVRVPMEKPR